LPLLESLQRHPYKSPVLVFIRSEGNLPREQIYSLVSNSDIVKPNARSLSTKCLVKPQVPRLTRSVRQRVTGVKSLIVAEKLRASAALTCIFP